MSSIAYSPYATPSIHRPLFTSIAFWLAAACLCTVLESWTALDGFVQRLFFQNGKWLISKAFHDQYGWLLYMAPKRIIAMIAVGFLLLFAASCHKRHRATLATWRKPALFAVCCIAFIPLLVSCVKAVTGIYSPIDMIPYGGNHPHTGLITQLLLFHETAGGRSFPAGHASGGFALMGLAFLPLDVRHKRFLLGLGLTAGTLMGLYQMARGQHFLSHTLVTFCLAAAVTLLLARLMNLSLFPKVYDGTI